MKFIPGMTEKEFIDGNQREQDAELLRDLVVSRKIGFLLSASDSARQKRMEDLEINGYIRFGPPHGDIPYNCYHLTEHGEAELKRLLEKP